VFATNIGRIISIAIAAKSVGRKIGILGSSLYRVLKVASEMNYLPRGIEFVPEDEFSKYNKKDLLIISTGCQGQENSGLGRLADDSYRNIKLDKGDTVIFSASEIPGNEADINTIYNKLADKEVKIINSKNAFVHLSGHYTKNELKEMYELVKPKIAITTHGENMQLVEHKRVAEELGIRSVIRGKNGTIFKLNLDGTIKVVGEIKVVNSVVDGKRMLPINSNILLEREKMMDGGIIVINLVIDRRYRFVAPVTVEAVGNYNLSHDKMVNTLLLECINKSYKIAFQNMENPENKEQFNTDEKRDLRIEREIKKNVENHVYNGIGKRPFILVNILKTGIGSNSASVSENKPPVAVNENKEVAEETAKVVEKQQRRRGGGGSRNYSSENDVGSNSSGTVLDGEAPSNIALGAMAKRNDASAIKRVVVKSKPKLILPKREK
jgi:mRNA degradation ribonuclease J1/J2